MTALIKRGCLEQDYTPTRKLKPLIAEIKASIAEYNPIPAIVVNDKYEMPVAEMVLNAIYNVIVIQKWHSNKEYRLSRCILQRLN